MRGSFDCGSAAAVNNNNVAAMIPGKRLILAPFRSALWSLVSFGRSFGVARVGDWGQECGELSDIRRERRIVAAVPAAPEGVVMRNVVLSLSVSLDGFIEGPNREIDWHLVDEELHQHFNDDLR